MTGRSIQFRCSIPFFFLLLLIFKHNPACADTYSHTFSSGWQIISLPCIHSSSVPSEIFVSPFEQVYGMEDGEYKYFTDPGLTSAGAGFGYWAWFESDTPVSMDCDPATGDDFSVALTTGWNMIGTPFSSSTWSSSTINQEPVESSSLIEASLYTFATGTSSYATTDKLMPWQGYFIKVSSDSTLSLKGDGSGSTTPDPDQPTNVSATPCIYGQHTLLCITWTAAQEPAVTGYNVYVYHETISSDDPFNSKPVSVEALRYTAGGLTPGETYGIEVTSLIDDGMLVKESSHSDRSTRSTIKNSGNTAVVSFRTAEESGGTGRVAGRAAVAKMPGRLQALFPPGRSSAKLDDNMTAVASATVKLFQKGGLQVATTETDLYGWGELSFDAGSTDPADYKFEAKKENLVAEKNVKNLAGGKSRSLGTVIMAVGEFLGLFTDIEVAPSGDVFLVNTNGENIIRIQQYSPTGVFSSQRTAEEIGADTIFGVAVDAAGDIYITDDSANIVRKFTPSFTPGTPATFEPSSSPVSQFDNPTGIAIDRSAGFLYVADSLNNRIVKFATDGTYLAEWGTLGTADEEFNTPISVAVDSSGNVFVVDTWNYRIQSFDSSGTFITKWGQVWGGQAAPLESDFFFPWGICVDDDGAIFVSDVFFSTVQEFTSEGGYTRTIGPLWGGTGDLEFSFPTGISFDTSGNKYVADAMNYRIQVINASPSLVRQWEANDDVIDTPGFVEPADIAFDSSGNIYVSDTGISDFPTRYQRIKKLTPEGEFISQWGSFGTDTSQFGDGLVGIAIDSNDNVYVVDTGNHRFQKFTSDGTNIGIFGSEGSGDGQFEVPAGIDVDSGDNTFIVDAANFRVQKFNSNGAYQSQFGESGIEKGTFMLPIDLAINNSDEIYVTDLIGSRVQKFASSGAYITEWGYWGEAAGTFNGAAGIAADSTGNIYVVNAFSCQVQKFTGDGAFMTMWGSCGEGVGQFDNPSGIEVDANDNVCVVDSGNSRYQCFDKIAYIDQLPHSNCGNSTEENGEECDDGGTTDGDGCNSICRYETFAAISHDISANTVGYSAEPTSDGGFIITGSTYNGTDNDLFLRKIRIDGTAEWTSTVDAGQEEAGYSVKELDGGGYVVAGLTVDFMEGDILVEKFDSGGGTVWGTSFTYDEAGNSDGAYSVELTDDGGYLVAGFVTATSTERISILKVNGDGTLAWAKKYGTEYNSMGYSISKTTDNEYLVSAQTSNANSESLYYIFKIDGNGDAAVDWPSPCIYGETDIWYMRPFAVQTTDGYYIAAGLTNSQAIGNADIRVRKFDSSCSTIWENFYGGTSDDNVNSVDATPDGGAIIGGYTFSFSYGHSDAYVIKIDSSGNENWSVNYGGPEEDNANSIRALDDGGYLMGGYTFSAGEGESDFVIMKLNPDGACPGCF